MVCEQEQHGSGQTPNPRVMTVEQMDRELRGLRTTLSLLSNKTVPDSRNAYYPTNPERQELVPVWVRVY